MTEIGILKQALFQHRWLNVLKLGLIAPPVLKQRSPESLTWWWPLRTGGGHTVPTTFKLWRDAGAPAPGAHRHPVATGVGNGLSLPSAAIWQALNHYAYRDAVFLAERLYAEVHSEEALFLLATCYYRSGKAYKAYRLLKGHSCATAQCKYLLAKCCVDLSKLAEGEQVLSGGVLNKQKSHEEIVTEYGDSACFTLSLLGHVYCKTDRLPKGSECYQKSLSLNPFLWSPFESLCEIGTSPGAGKDLWGRVPCRPRLVHWRPWCDLDVTFSSC
ncbi:hypothetical protein FKM82_025227 [Ascaphus truei]